MTDLRLHVRHNTHVQSWQIRFLIQLIISDYWSAQRRFFAIIRSLFRPMASVRLWRLWKFVKFEYVTQWLKWKIRGGRTVESGLGPCLWLWAPLLESCSPAVLQFGFGSITKTGVRLKRKKMSQPGIINVCSLLHFLQTSQNCFVYKFMRSRRICDILILSRRL